VTKRKYFQRRTNSMLSESFFIDNFWFVLIKRQLRDSSWREKEKIHIPNKGNTCELLMSSTCGIINQYSMLFQIDPSIIKQKRRRIRTLACKDYRLAMCDGTRWIVFIAVWHLTWNTRVDWIQMLPLEKRQSIEINSTKRWKFM